MPQKATAVALQRAEPASPSSSVRLRSSLALSSSPSSTLTAGVARPTPMQDLAAHGDIELNFVYSGGLRSFMGGRFVELCAGALSLHWAALPRQIVAVE